ncbi:MAG: response regulator, partial [Planctomycetota bacterium]
EALECDRKGIELIGRISSEMPDLIVGDPGRLGQVLVNLLSNAVKFTEQGQVAVSIDCVRFADGEARFRLEVEDSGPGICQKQLQEIFSAFHQADTSNHRKHGGTGLGLAICRQLVELMGGRIWAESSPGNGARFLVDLTVEARAACSDPRSRQLQQRRVLLVESNPDQCKALVEQVEQLGMSVQVAGSGSAAEAMLIDSARRGECPEVTILSADLQDEDGLELAGQLARSRQIATKLILLGRISSNGDVVSRSHEAGAVGILHKPVADGDLRDAICEALGIESQEQQQAPGRQQSDAPEADRCLRILVAEDNPVNQRLASILLEKKGHTVLQATDGCKAVEAFKAEAIDVILMDIQMPEMDGLAATQEIRRLEWAGGGGHIPIIAMTAHAMQRDKQRCLQGGMDFYLSKPIRAGELYETLQRAANGPGLGDLPAEPTTDEPGEAFDVARALRNLDDDLNLLGQLAEMALQEIPQQVRTVDCAIAASDAGGLVDASLVIAHSAGSLSARSVAESARRLAQVAEDGDWECVTAAAAKMKQDLQALLKGIEGFILRREPAA